jgi:hypothetical protein
MHLARQAGHSILMHGLHASQMLRTSLTLTGTAMCRYEVHRKKQKSTLEDIKSLILERFIDRCVWISNQ